MIKKHGIWVVAFLLMACSSTDKESQNSSSKGITLERSDSGNYISEGIQSAVSSKRRGKLGRLKADGPAWFSFNIPASFQELQLTLINGEKPMTITWEVGGEKSEEKLPLKKIDPELEEVLIDVVVSDSNMEVYFNEGSERFVFKLNLSSSDTKIEVALDSQSFDPPGVLYDIGN